MGHCWWNKDELISDVLLWTSSHKRRSIGWPAGTYLQQLCMDTGCSLEDQEAMDDRNKYRERRKSVLVAWHDDDDEDDNDRKYDIAVNFCA